MLLLALLLGFLAAPAAHAAPTLTLAPVADASVRADQPDAALGRLTTLRVDNSPVARSYLKFSVRGLTRSVRRATLRLSARTAAGDSGVEVRPASSAWDEGTLTYRSAPLPGAVVAKSGAFAAGDVVALDVTKLVQGNGTISLAVTTTSGTSRTFASREDAGLRPQLVVEQRPHLAGASMHPLWGSTSVADFDRELDLAKAAGMDIVRADLGWATIEEQGKGQYAQWYVDKADTFFAHAKARGLKVLVTFFHTPCWASSAPEDLKQGCTGAWWDRGVHVYPPTNPADFADAVEWVVRRWGSQMHAIEIWNEPNHPAWMKGPDPAAGYAAMLKAAYPRVKAARPSVQVLGGALVYSDGAYLTDLYDRLGVKGSFDGLSYHPFAGRDPDDASPNVATKYNFQLGTQWIRDIMVARGDGAKEMWMTEVGFPTCTPGAHVWCVTPEKQAEYDADHYRIAREKWPFVRGVITYNMRNKGTDPGEFEEQMGLLWRDFTPKPAYYAVRDELTR